MYKRLFIFKLSIFNQNTQKMRKITFITVLFAGLLSFSSFVQSSLGQWLSFHQGNVSIQYLDTWNVQENHLGAKFFLFSPQESSQDLFRENINLMSEDISAHPNVSLEQYAELSREAIKGGMNNVRFIDSGIIQAGGEDVYQWTYTAKQGNYKLKIRQRIIKRGTMMYILTFTSEKKEFSKFEDTVMKIFDSFSIS